LPCEPCLPRLSWDCSQYLEVGSWRGSTLASALSGNEHTVHVAAAVDSWEDWVAEDSGKIFDWAGGSGEETFRAAVKAVRLHSRAKDDQVFLIRRDFRSVPSSDWEAIERARSLASGAAGHPGGLARSGAGLGFNVYFFDGPHSEEDHYDALLIMWPRLAGTFVFLVDDWNCAEARRGTERALRDLGLRYGLRVLYAEALGSGRQANDLGPWHNGLFLSVLQKPA